MRKFLKTIFVVGLFAALLPGQFVAPGRKNTLVTVTSSGTPVQVTTNIQLLADRLLIQAKMGATTSVGYICIVPAGTTPHSKCTTAGELAAQLAAASSTAPGGSYSDTTPSSQTAGIQMSTIWIDADTSNTVFIVSYNSR